MGETFDSRLTGVCECGGRVFEILVESGVRASRPFLEHKCSDCNKRFKIPPNREKVKEELDKIREELKNKRR